MSTSGPIRVVNEVDPTEDAVGFLTDQHQQVRVLLAQVLGARGRERQAAFDSVREMLARHETAEQMILRPLTRSAPGGDAVADERMREENKAKAQLAHLEQLDVAGADFAREFSAFEQAVLAHAQAEEQAEFPLLRAHVAEEKLRLAEQGLAEAEATAPTRPHP